MKRTPAVIALLAALLPPAVATAAFGEPDASFASPVLASSGCSYGAFAILGDQGALVAWDPTPNGSIFDGAIARLRSDGSLDPRWGEGGVMRYGGLRRSTTVRDIHRLADGGFLAVGSSALRFRADGSLDAAYGDGGQSDGFVEPGDYLSAIPQVHSTAVRPDGSVVALMTARSSVWGALFMTARIGPDGRRDRTFQAFLGALDPNRVTPYAWGVEASGRVQLATIPGTWRGGTGPQLHRYPGDFTLADAAAGRLMPRDVVALWTATTARVDPQGRVYIATSCGSDACDGERFVVARFGADGLPDPSFGNGGYVRASASASDDANGPRAINLGANGSITVLVEAYVQGSDSQLKAVRFTEDGRLDATFPRGRALASNPGTVAFDEAGRILLASSSVSTPCQVRRLLGDQPRSDAVMVEYRYRDRYFITAEGFESAILDDDPATEKLRRTGRTFGAWQPAAQLPGALPLCRFSGDPVAGPVGHFYALQGPECDLVRADDDRLPAGTRTWRFEGLRFHEAAPSPSGTCPPNLQPVYRLYNDAARRGGDPNHRFVTDPSGIAEMQAQGWISEGTLFCAPPMQAIR